MKVFNGLKGIAVLLTGWGLTFFFSFYSFLSNPNDIDDMKNSYFFNIVTGTVYTAPLFFFCSGFLQTLSLLEKDKIES